MKWWRRPPHESPDLRVLQQADREAREGCPVPVEAAEILLRGSPAARSRRSAPGSSGAHPAPAVRGLCRARRAPLGRGVPPLARPQHMLTGLRAPVQTQQAATGRRRITDSALRDLRHPAERSAHRRVRIRGRQPLVLDAVAGGDGDGGGMSCEHVTDLELIDFYGRRPALICARCWLALADTSTARPVRTRGRRSAGRAGRLRRDPANPLLQIGGRW